MNLPEDLKRYRAERPARDYWLGYLMGALVCVGFVFELLSRGN